MQSTELDREDNNLNEFGVSGVQPSIYVSNVENAADYYFEILGFYAYRCEGYVNVSIGSCGLNLFEYPSDFVAYKSRLTRTKKVAWDASFWINDMDGYYSKLSHLGAKFRRHPSLLVGVRVMDVVDMDGNVLRFAEEETGSGMLCRKPFP